MNFNKHYELNGRHATLSASKYHWLGYNEDELANYLKSLHAAQEGTELHNLAAEMIRKKIKPERTQKTFNMYVRDCIGFRMTPEQPLVYSENAFGTADAISFRKNKLRIFDLKTGTGRVSMKQLEIYAAFFCLEYGFKPGELEIELRIYQNNEILFHNPEVEDIAFTMDRTIDFDRRIVDWRDERAEALN